MSADRRTARLLKKLYNLEVMAVQIYRTQIGVMGSVAERSMMQDAMENEAHHRETFRSLLEARGIRPSPAAPLFWLVGQILGRTTALFGRNGALRGDIAFEEKASREYAEFLDHDGFTDEETVYIREFLEDEKRHAGNWKRLLAG